MKKVDFGPKLRIRGAGQPYLGQVTLVRIQTVEVGTCTGLMNLEHEEVLRDNAFDVLRLI